VEVLRLREPEITWNFVPGEIGYKATFFVILN